MALKNKDIRALSATQQKERVTEIHKELLKLQAQRATGASQKNNQQIRTLRRTKARLLTALRQGGPAKQ